MNMTKYFFILRAQILLKNCPLLGRSLLSIYTSTYDVRGVGLMRSCNAMQNKFGGKLPNSVIWKSAEYYSIESSILTGS